MLEVPIINVEGGNNANVAAPPGNNGLSCGFDFGGWGRSTGSMRFSGAVTRYTCLNTCDGRDAQFAEGKLPFYCSHDRVIVLTTHRLCDIVEWIRDVGQKLQRANSPVQFDQPQVLPINRSHVHEFENAFRHLHASQKQNVVWNIWLSRGESKVYFECKAHAISIGVLSQGVDVSKHKVFPPPLAVYFPRHHH